MKLIILESPYYGRIDENIAYARQCVRDALHRGEAPIASHLLYTQDGILDDHNPVERAWGISAGLAWRQRADYSVFYTDLGWSGGMIAALRPLIKLKQAGSLKIRSLEGSPQLPEAETGLYLKGVMEFLVLHLDHTPTPAPVF